MNQTYTAYYQSPIGLIEIVAGDQAIKSVYFVDAERAAFGEVVRFGYLDPEVQGLLFPVHRRLLRQDGVLTIDTSCLRVSIPRRRAENHASNFWAAASFWTSVAFGFSAIPSSQYDLSAAPDSFIQAITTSRISSDLMRWTCMDISQIMKEPDAQEKLKAIGFEAIVKNQAETVDYFRSEIANWGKMTRAIGFSN